jgi:hypothetical protein
VRWTARGELRLGFFRVKNAIREYVHESSREWPGVGASRSRATPPAGRILGYQGSSGNKPCCIAKRLAAARFDAPIFE